MVMERRRNTTGMGYRKMDKWVAVDSYIQRLVVRDFACAMSHIREAYVVICFTEIDFTSFSWLVLATLALVQTARSKINPVKSQAKRDRILS